jgi:soluble lytic murein transglycosylase-like protein
VHALEDGLERPFQVLRSEERSDMTALNSMKSSLGTVATACQRSAGVFARDVARGLVAVSHNTLALVGLVSVAAAVTFVSQADLRKMVEGEVFGWLLARHEARQDPAELLAAELSEPDAIARATAADPASLTRQQALIANWISKRYRVAAEPVSRLVQEAWHVGQRVGLDPTLILAIMAVESSFNPFAESPVGAQGLMQVMTRVHDDKYQGFGGKHAAFDPVTNLRVGVQVLKECITRAGSLEAGLKYYVGAANLADDGGYASKVLAEQANLRAVAQGRQVPISTPLIAAPQMPPKASEPTAPAAPANHEVAATEQLALAR